MSDLTRLVRSEAFTQVIRRKLTFHLDPEGDGHSGMTSVMQEGDAWGPNRQFTPLTLTEELIIRENEENYSVKIRGPVLDKNGLPTHREGHAVYGGWANPRPLRDIPQSIRRLLSGPAALQAAVLRGNDPGELEDGELEDEDEPGEWAAPTADTDGDGDLSVDEIDDDFLVWMSL